jgi:hypothetical protein
MSANKTEHYHLHQWAGADPVSLPEVNHNFSVLDAAVARAQEAAAEVPYVVGTYTGTGKGGNKIALPFHASFLVIGYLYGPADSATTCDAVLAFGAEGRSKVVTMEDDGFTPVTSAKYPLVNVSNAVYVYIAFR